MRKEEDEMGEQEKARRYPLAEHHAGSLRTPSGKRFADITLEAALRGEVKQEDLRVSAEALEWQAQLAEAAGRRQLAENLRRAAELTAVPEEALLKIYESLRPGRASRPELEAWAEALEKKYGAARCARFVREAAEAYGEAEGRQTGGVEQVE